MLGRAWALLRHGVWVVVAALVAACGGGGDTSGSGGNSGTSGNGPTVVAMQFVAGSPDRLEVTFSEPMNPTYYTTGGYVPTSSVWETSTKFVITFSSVSPGGFITLKAPTAGDTRGFRAVTGGGMLADVNFQFPNSASPGAAPTVIGLNYVDATPARLEVTFSGPMSSDYGTTGAYVPVSSVWETTTKFVITFSSVTPGGSIVLKAPAGGAGGFRSSTGVAMPSDVSFRFPTPPGSTANGPVITGLNYVATAPARLEVTFSEPMGIGFGTTGNYVPSSSVWETTTKFVITFSSVTSGGSIVLQAGSFRSVAGTAMSANLPFTFPVAPAPGSGAPAITGINYLSADPARLEVSFSEPMAPGGATVGAYVPTSSVWETTTKFVITFASITPGGVITLVAPTPGNAFGFRSAAGVGMAADLPFQFPARN